MIRIITLTLTGTVAALAFSAATAHADPDAPTPIDVETNFTVAYGPGLELYVSDQYFGVFNVPDETFEGVVREGFDFFGDENYNISVQQDISGTVPVGEQYNDYTPYFGSATGEYGLVYNDLGGTPEAFFFTPFGDINFPTWFVEALGSTFFEPSFYTEPSLYATTSPAAELPALTADLPQLLAGLW
jgi:hypothetical protein